MKRRDFLKNSALLVAAASVPEVLRAADVVPDAAKDDGSSSDLPLIGSAPMLQNYAETSVGIAFAVNAMANGYVLYGEKEDLSDARKVYCGGFRVTDISDKVILVRLTGLKPATKYYYRIFADRLSGPAAYKAKILGTESDPRTYSFTTAGAAAKSHFCVINDTHVRWKHFSDAIEKIAAISPSCVVWNGDASNVEETFEDQKRIFLVPEIDRKDYAAQLPYLFCPGNHDDRGMANRHLERVWMYRQPEERSSRDWDLGRNFAVRMGEIAMIGLDTAEDKVDTNPRLSNMYNSAPYREAQTRWLKDALELPEIKSAPYLVAFCHIPLFDDNPEHNPGDVFPADKDPQYSTDYAMWQRTCARMWGPLLSEAGCQLLITAHQHRYRYDAPTAERPWAQIVGGGPNESFVIQDGVRIPRPERFPTVIEGFVHRKKLVVKVHNLNEGSVQDEFSFSPRK